MLKYSMIYKRQIYLIVLVNLDVMLILTDYKCVCQNKENLDQYTIQ